MFILFSIVGIGIDDMFVIMQCLSNLSDEQKSTLPLAERIGQTMRKAGVAITVTSLTDVCAFGVGAVTVCICERFSKFMPTGKFCAWA